MGIFHARPDGYKGGLLLLLFSITCYMTGFASPYWSIYHAAHVGGYDGINLSYPYLYEEIRGHNGLWETCDTLFGFSTKTCAKVSHQHGHSGWISAVQGLQCVGLTGLIAACGFAVFVNFIQSDPSVKNRYLEISVILSGFKSKPNPFLMIGLWFLLSLGVLGFAGSAIYAAESYRAEDILIPQDNSYNADTFHGNELADEFIIDQNELAWGYYLNLTSCMLAFVSAFIICAFNRLVVVANPRPVAGVSFSVAGGTGNVGGALIYLPPGHLAGGFYPPPYWSPGSAVDVQAADVVAAPDGHHTNDDKSARAMENSNGSALCHEQKAP